MDITKRADYALRIMRVVCQSDIHRSVADIALEQDIPYSFARSIQHDLVQSGLLKTARGARGGITLNCDPTQTSITTVLTAIGISLDVCECAHNKTYCNNQLTCAYNKMWLGAGNLLREYFDAIMLADLIEQGADHPIVKEALLSHSSDKE